jgi:hypothetical protein
MHWSVEGRRDGGVKGLYVEAGEEVERKGERASPSSSHEMLKPMVLVLLSKARKTLN